MAESNAVARCNVLVMTKGHPFNREDFYRIFDDMVGVNACAIEQPASQAFFDPALAAPYDAFVLYDMPGLDFSAEQSPAYLQPPESFKNNFLQLLELGHGFVFLHHSIAAWPGWPEYAEIVGGKFLYKADKIRRKAHPDSGYRHDVKHTVTVALEHPVTEAVEASFGIEDELYLSHVFRDDVLPLLRSDYDYTDENFYSAQQAVKGEMFSREGWSHQRGHNLIGWIKSYKNSPIVYLQCGDSKQAYDNANYRKLVSNAIAWVSSAEAKDWARRRR